MKILENYDLTPLNTFGMRARARFFVEVNNESDLKELFLFPEFKNNSKMFLGGGSNVLFTNDFDGIIVLNKLKGVDILREDNKNVFIRSMGGEIWHNLVSFTVEKGYWGIENLALIPGTVGAAPMQNIGAYGVELKDILENVEVFEIETGAKKVFKKTECEFGYRDSVFKSKFKGKYFISAITLQLSKIPKPNISYKFLREYLESNKIIVKNSKASPVASPIRLQPRDVADAVAEIRRSKLPDPKVIGNAGSFFKNVFLSEVKIKILLEKFPDMPIFKENEVVKIPSAWLIEHCGPKDGISWKGYKEGSVGVHIKQALVLVHYGGGTGLEVKNLAEKIISSVYDKFGIKMETEVNII